MINFLFWGMLLLLAATAIFYVVFVSLIYYWHETRITLLVFPLMYTFEFFITGFLIVALLSIVLQYLPDIVKLLGT
jgi:hypothetical protein